MRAPARLKICTFTSASAAGRVITISVADVNGLGRFSTVKPAIPSGIGVPDAEQVFAARSVATSAHHSAGVFPPPEPMSWMDFPSGKTAGKNWPVDQRLAENATPS